MAVGPILGWAAKGSGVGVSFDGGLTFAPSTTPGLTKCSAGTIVERASDAWLSFSPSGTLYAMSFVETKLATGPQQPERDGGEPVHGWWDHVG